MVQGFCFGLAVAVRRRCSSLARIDGEVSNCHGYAMFAYIVRVVSTPGAKIPYIFVCTAAVRHVPFSSHYGNLPSVIARDSWVQRADK